ncbi:MAG: hypothetical protein ACE5JP_16115 [Candidatus Bipolaricaulia bacterium]
MRLRGWRLASGILVVVLVILALAQETPAETLPVKGRIVQHMTKIEVIEVGDVPGHVVGVMESKGLVFMEDGEIGLYSHVLTFDYTNGSGPFQGYSLITYEDGSIQVSKAQGSSTVAQAGAFGVITLFEGTFEWIMGTGRYEGIQGSGSFSGKRLAPLAVGADTYLDLTGTYTLP